MINVHANFETWPMAMSLLFRMSTGESWNGVMHDCMVQPPFCNPANDDCGLPNIAVLYFVSFTFFTTLVMINIFVAVILQNFEQQVAREKDPPVVTSEHFASYVRIWTQFAKNNGEKEMETVSISRISTIINLVPPPLGRSGKELTRMEMKEFLSELNLPATHDGKVHIMDLGMALTMRVYLRQLNMRKTIPSNSNVKIIRKKIQRMFPNLKQMHRQRSCPNELIAALTIQRFWRNMKKRKAARLRKLDNDDNDNEKQCWT